jgi:DNA-binding GntR family transcriptional regulator
MVDNVVAHEGSSRVSADHPAPERPRNVVVRQLLSEQIADALRREIIHGDLAPGSRLVQEELCKQFGTSRMPVRDALQQLTHEGLLVEVGGQREVIALSREDLIESQSLAGVLHGWAARRVAEIGDDDDIGALEAIHRESAAVVDAHEFTRLSWQFHRKINQFARSPRLVAVLEMLQKTTPRVFPLESPPSIGRARRQHGEIIKAMKARDYDAVEALARRHANEAAEELLTNVGE